MDYEKKYKEALERAQQAVDKGYVSQNFVDDIFPEHKESEDERIRKGLIKTISSLLDNTILYHTNITKEEALAWLEKQKETNEEIIFRPIVGTDIRIAAKQALEKIDIGKKVVLAFNGAYIPVNGKTVGEIDSEYDAWLEKQGKQTQLDYEHADIPQKDFAPIEPKFHEGEWITNGYDTWKIVEVKPLDYILQSQDGNIVDDTISYVDEQFHSFAIEDAKAGDVLKGNIKDSNGIKYERICLFNNLDNAFFTLTKTSNYVEEYDIDVNVNIDYPDNTIPATKGQKEILFMVMKEAGYEWDADKKELKKIEPKKLDADKVIEWLKNIIEERVMHFRAYKETRLALPYNSIEDFINDFKEDFGLC